MDLPAQARDLCIRDAIRKSTRNVNAPRKLIEALSPKITQVTQLFKKTMTPQKTPPKTSVTPVQATTPVTTPVKPYPAPQTPSSTDSSLCIELSDQTLAEVAVPSTPKTRRRSLSMPSIPVEIERTSVLWPDEATREADWRDLLHAFSSESSRPSSVDEV